MKIETPIRYVDESMEWEHATIRNYRIFQVIP